MAILRIHPADNVAVAVNPIRAGETFDVGEIRVTALADLPFGHKLALRELAAGERIVKYGHTIGSATAAIKKGEHVHTHNVKTNLAGALSYFYEPALTPPPLRTPNSFMGFRRKSGSVGVRNEIWIIPTVGCVNAIAEAIARKSRGLLEGSLGDVVAFPHPYGCSQLGEDHENTKKALCGLAKHPNAGGVLILGLGCENNGMGGMRETLGEVDENRVKFLVCQEHDDEVAVALGLVEELIAAARGDEREPIPTSELIVGLKCGGSDGLSGVTANPLVGAFSDRLIGEGGSTILTEVPEMFGAETILMNRCKNELVYDKTVALINDFKEYFLKQNQPVYENPSPGNKDGGITTLEDKSLGCTQKGGCATVVDVLLYGERLREKGLNLLQAPGNDLVASTALAVSGAHVVLFTTGRGTPFGSPVPTVKISTNTLLSRKKKGWIDFDAGVLTSGANMEELSERFYAYVIALASGEIQTKTEQNGIRDMTIFKNGITV